LGIEKKSSWKRKERKEAIKVKQEAKTSYFLCRLNPSLNSSFCSSPDWKILKQRTAADFSLKLVVAHAFQR
jgi:hypothetical protein